MKESTHWMGRLFSFQGLDLIIMAILFAQLLSVLGGLSPPMHRTCGIPDALVGLGSELSLSFNQFGVALCPPCGGQVG
ncbi:hypothetical protein [Streptomyces sp. NPDC050416]|uniref:hypothetical protein n=1 Tax=Streptomyces sp. NPDC050416 TaxID=3365611 RepID=UPI0037AB668F